MLSKMSFFDHNTFVYSVLDAKRIKRFLVLNLYVYIFKYNIRFNKVFLSNSEFEEQRRHMEQIYSYL